MTAADPTFTLSLTPVDRTLHFSAPLCRALARAAGRDASVTEAIT